MAKKRCKSSSRVPFTSQKTELNFWQPEVASFKKHSQKPTKNNKKMTRKTTKNGNVNHPTVKAATTLT
jgi:hypothetical protein